MVYNIELQISALLFLVIVSIAFFCKIRKWTPDNKAFAKLVIVTFFLVADDIVCPILLATPEAPVFAKILTGKLYLIFMFFVLACLCEYTLSLTFEDMKEAGAFGKLHHFIYRNCSLFAAVLSAAAILLPLNFYNQDGKVYIYGPAQDLCYAVGAVLAVAIPLYTLKHCRQIPLKKQLPLYAYVLIQGTAALLESMNKELLLNSLALVLVITLLYFTLQNPDIVLLEEKNLKEHELIEQMVAALADSVDAKDHYTSGHSFRVARYADLIAKEVGLDDQQLEQLYFMAVLHDVGKIGIPDGIINKDGKLTEEEYYIIKQHPVIGGRMLEKIAAIPGLYLCAKYHHERYDGTGYPEGLKGEDIPLEARIVGIADAYDAMSSTRSYRNVMPQEKIREQLVRGKGTQFDPDLLDIMLRLMDADINYDMREKNAESA